MNQYGRALGAGIEEHLSWFPVVALLGPRQCGKTTLALQIAERFPEAIYLDMESPKDHAKLDDAELFLETLQGRLLILDEIQFRPALFPVLRSFVDKTNGKSPVLIIGSASRDLLQQSSESLAGRIAYLELTPLLLREVSDVPLFQQWTRGGFPKSLISPKDALSMAWRRNYIRSFLERDLPQLGLKLPIPKLQRLLQLLAHSHGGLLNSSKLGEALGVTHNTFRGYVDFLEQSFVLRTLPPCETNLKKRLVKSPKVFFRDVGILHALLELATFDAILGHPCQGESWEGFALEQILSSLPDGWRASFYRTQVGAELDLVLEKGERRIGIEFKASMSPKVTRGFWTCLEDLAITESWIICPIEDQYPFRKGTQVSGIRQFLHGFD